MINFKEVKDLKHYVYCKYSSPIEQCLIKVDSNNTKIHLS